MHLIGKFVNYSGLW